MNTHKLSIKFFIDGAADLRAESLVPMFHGWIQGQAMPDHLLIDVADYEHVAEGPGTVLIAHEANIHIDRGEDRPGVMYVRKQPLEGSFQDRLRACLRYALIAADRVEKDMRGVKLRTDEAVLRIHDRLHAPNTPQTFQQVRPDLEAVLKGLLGEQVQLEQRPDASGLFEVRIRSAGAPAGKALLERLHPVGTM
jgi:hypothetical protein